MTTPYGWGIYQCDNFFHIIPVDEADRHEYEHCTCGPAEGEHNLIVHQSFDGREKFETGERKPS